MIIATDVIKRIVSMQIGLTVLPAIIVYLLFDVEAAYSVLIGGGISIIGTVYFAWHVFHQAGLPPEKMIKRFYSGEAVKLLLTAALFIVVLNTVDVLFMPLIGTYIATLLVFWPILMSRSALMHVDDEN